jgi:hypothetical protein
MKIRFNNKGFDELRTSAGAQALVKQHADRIEAAANAIPSTTTPAATEPYYESHEAGDEHRARYRIATTGIRAYRHDVKTQALLRSLSSDG